MHATRNAPVRASSSLVAFLAEQDREKPWLRSVPAPLDDTRLSAASLPNPIPTLETALAARSTRITDQLSDRTKFPHRREAKLFIAPLSFCRPLSFKQRRDLFASLTPYARATRCRARPHGFLTPKCEAVYTALISFCHRTTGLCCPSIATLANAAGCHRDTVNESLKTLVECGFIEVQQRLVHAVIPRECRKTGRFTPTRVVQQGTNLYRICPPGMRSADPLAPPRGRASRRRMTLRGQTRRDTACASGEPIGNLRALDQASKRLIQAHYNPSLSRLSAEQTAIVSGCILAQFHT